MEFGYEISRPSDGTLNAVGRTVHAAVDTTGRPCRLPDYIRELLRMKALVTGAAGFIGSHLSAALLDSGGDGDRHRLLHRLLPPAAEGSEPRDAAQTGRASRSSRPRLQDVDLRAAARRRDPRFPSGGPGGRAEKLGTRFRRLYKEQRRGDAAPARGPAWDVPIQKYVYASSSSVYGDDVPLPMREDTYLQPLSPYGVTKLAAEHLGNLYWANHGVPAVSLRYFTV